MHPSPSRGAWQPFVARDELVVDRVGVLDDEVDALTGFDVDIGRVEVREVDADVHGARRRWPGVAIARTGGDRHGRAGEQERKQHRPDPAARIRTRGIKPRCSIGTGDVR